MGRSRVSNVVGLYNMEHRAVNARPLEYSLRICEFCLPPVADADRRDAAKAHTSPCVRRMALSLARVLRRAWDVDFAQNRVSHQFRLLERLGHEAQVGRIERKEEA